MEASTQRASTNARRLPFDAKEAIHVVIADAARFGAGLRGVVPDRILLDMPCTGSGSLAAYPELKARQSSKDVAFFADLQSRILGSVLDACSVNRWNDVHIVYSTCSYYPEEGEEIIDRIMDKIDLIDLHDPRGPVARLSLLPAGWKGHACSPRVARTFPDTNAGSKAFFIAAFTPRI
jgi:16S rRNA C967 or C1407 C5-methylase (RsmB/RsmF family)